MKVLFLTRSLHAGGAERQLVLLARGLVERGHEVHVVSWYGGGRLSAELVDADVLVHDLAKTSRWRVGGFLWRAICLSRRLRPDVIHGVLPGPNLMATLLKWTTPGARCVWGIRTSDLRWDRLSRVERSLYALEQGLAWTADALVTNSSRALSSRRFASSAQQRRCVVPNGIDTAVLVGNADAGRRLREEWGVAPDAPLVGQVGRLDPVKDQEGFLAAAARVHQVRPEARFVCVGSDPWQRSAGLLAHARELGLADAFVWAGRRTDMTAVYAALDVLCSASLTEGFSNVVAEAMSCGTPCVVTDVGDSAIIVGALGRVVAPERPDLLARALLDTLVNPPDPASIRGRIVERYGCTRMVQRSLVALGPRVPSG